MTYFVTTLPSRPQTPSPFFAVLPVHCNATGMFKPIKSVQMHQVTSLKQTWGVKNKENIGGRHSLLGRGFFINFI